MCAFELSCVRTGLEHSINQAKLGFWTLQEQPIDFWYISGTFTVHCRTKLLIFGPPQVGGRSPPQGLIASAERPETQCCGTLGWLFESVFLQPGFRADRDSPLHQKWRKASANTRVEAQKVPTSGRGVSPDIYSLSHSLKLVPTVRGRVTRLLTAFFKHMEGELPCIWKGKFVL